MATGTVVASGLGASRAQDGRGRPRIKRRARQPQPALAGLEKVLSGVPGLDEVLGGGLPSGRPTLLCGAAGCGKTLLAMQFLCRGASAGEPGLFVSFEESEADLVANTAALGFDLPRLQADGLVSVEAIYLDPAEIVEAGEYDLEGLFLRLSAAVDAVGARRIVIDTVEVLFAALSDERVIRAELRRLFGWIKARGLTAIVTAESGEDGRISRHGIEEYVSDCVIVLDHRVSEELSTRRLRVVKYRGSQHATNEYPFLISGGGVTVAPITSLQLRHPASTSRVSLGVERLDALLSGGVFRASSIVVSGTAGTGKSTLAASFVDAACRRGEKALLVSYEESPDQIVRNMASVGLDLGGWVAAGLLRVESIRPTFFGLETHLAWLHGLLEDADPQVVAIDPISSITRAGTGAQVTSVLMREIDMLKSRSITALFTELIQENSIDETQLAVSSLMDTWLRLDTVEGNGERNRTMSIIKSRGTTHSNQLCEFVIGAHGIEVSEPYVGPAGVLTGSARLTQHLADTAAARERAEDVALTERLLAGRRAALEAAITALHADYAVHAEELERRRAAQQHHSDESAAQQAAMSQLRWASATAQHEPTVTSERSS